MSTIKVTAVSYLNTVPLLYGLRQAEIMKCIDLHIAPPSQCALQLEQGTTDIALIPVAALFNIPHYEIISNYCIGATGKVRTVVLLTNDALSDIHTVYLDPDSRTSVMLVQLLAKYHWKIAPSFQPYTEGQNIAPGEACVLIGDKVFAKENQFIYRHDLAEEWIQFTGVPFVFAVWASIRPLSADFLSTLNKAMDFGIHHIIDALTEPLPCSRETAIDYLTHNISYILDENKEKGLNSFYHFLNEYKI
jgi:chorismate dehydratase